jgi:hypothetical protein
MKRPTVIVVIVTLCAGLASCNSNDSRTVADRAVSTPTTAAQNNNSPQPFKSGRTYTRGVAGEAAEGAPGASFFTLTSSDGMKFTKWTTDYETPERARAQLERKLAKALEIVSREPTKDTNGREVGETVVARFANNIRDAGPASLLWTTGLELCQVDSSSIQNILEYRKDFNH